MIRRISLLWFLTLLAIAPAAIGQATSVPDAPFFTRTINLAPGEQQTIEEAFSANSSCDAIGTRYVLVVKNGNPDGTGMVQSGAAAINMLDYVGDWLADGADVITMDVPLLSANVALLQGQAPPGSAAVLTMELWRKPVTGTPFHQAYSFPQSTVNKKYTASFPVADPSIPAMLVVTRIGGMQTADQFFIKLNGTNFFSRTNFQYPVETLVAFVNLLPTNSVVIDAVAASQSSEVTVRVVQHGADTTPPAINLTGTIPAKVGTNSFTFTGTVTDAYRVGSLKLNGTKVNFTSSSGAFTTTVPLTHGIPNEFTFLAYDCAGHGTQVVKVIEWDRDSPVVTVTSPAANAFVKGPITVTGTVTDDTLGSPTVKVNGITATVTGNNWSANITLPAPDGAKTITVVATDLFQRSSSATVPVTLDTTAPTITSSLLPPATGGWSRAGATLSFTCADAGSGIAECTEPVTFDTSDLFLTEGKATDRAGNEAVIGVGVRVDADAPVVAINAPAAVVNTSSLNLQGTVSDVGSGIASVRCNGVAATVSGGSYTCSVPIAPGNNELRVVATDVAGNESAAMAQTKLDQRAPSISISTPENSTTVNSATITIAGFVSDDEQVAAFRIGSNAVQFDEAGSFSYETPLVSGNNTFTLTATDGGGNTATQTLQVHRYVVPVVSITSPADFANVRDATITVTGTVSDPGATVAVNDLAASVGSGGNFTVAGIPLQQGRTVITAIASSPGGGSATTSINIYRDSIPPRLAVYSPEDGATVYASPISVSGMVDDIVVGTINANQMRVTVNGVQAEVSNRAWLMRDVVLAPGQNTLLITATDEGGNSSVLSYHVTLQVPQLPHLELVSGNGQSGTIGNVLPAPLVVRGVSPAGQPVPDVPLTFTILDNDGLLAGGGTEARSVTVATNAAGLASVQWKLGNRAGAGNNRLEIRGQGFAAPIEA
ncbi:MAG TPA: Ig-like domain-containing protein, partial [Thermoanaerobaculia bacterium]|nr:Ig-like domain-containing protein [Thermoanaerobaculia bacterium]